MTKATNSTPQERAERRVKDFTETAWHVAVFVIVNGFLWLVVPGAAVWITIFWGMALAFHLAYYFIGDGDRSNRRYQKYLAQEHSAETGDPT